MDEGRTQMNCKSSPLGGTRVKVSILHVQVAGAHSLRPKSIEQGNFCPTGDAH